MAFEKYIPEAAPVTTPPCVYMRSKRIYVTGSLTSPDQPEEAGSQHCWCNQTQHMIGPDNKEVEIELCVPGRDCYCESY